jgi:uncharacterized protein with NAD-binding domain and iron-sulfur cluster
MPVKKIAILGGGMGALTAAFQLTNTPNWDQQFDITVYQMGWRLGGKCATGRNQEMRSRIEEHGIHFLLGFYENAFHVIRQLYAEYLAHFPSPFGSWQDAFRNQRTTTTMVPNVGGGWAPFGITFPTAAGLPGDDARFVDGSGPPSSWSYIATIIKWMSTELTAIEGELDTDETAVTDHAVDLYAAGIPLFGEVFHQANDLAKAVRNVITQQMLTGLNSAFAIASAYATPPEPGSPALVTLIGYMEEFTVSLMSLLATPTFASGVKQVLILLDIAAAITRGMIVDGVIWHGFETIDNHELGEWLTLHGCRNSFSSVIRSGYDACFAYTGGDPHRPSISAAVGLHGALRLWFTYRGSIFWPMQSGMAEVIFTPMYHVLKQRGVKFNFFHRVTALGLSGDGTQIEIIDIDVQAEPVDAVNGYNPFIQVKGLDCWPNEPLYGQLVGGQNLRGHDLESAWAAPPPVGHKTLTLGPDFDLVVLGISLGALNTICKDLVAASPAWTKMVAGIPTVQTQALQLWLKATADQLGYSAGTPLPPPDPPCVSGFAEPFDTYVDMSTVRNREAWQPGDGTIHLAYFCNVMPDVPGAPAPGTDPRFPDRMHQLVKNNSLAFLQQTVLSLWPYCAAGRLS